MPTFIHGKDTYFSIDGTNISTFLDSVEPSFSTDEADTTTFGNESKTFILGLSEASFSLSGNFDGTDTTGIDDILWAIYEAKAAVNFEYGPGGNATGAVKYSGSCYITGYDPSTPVGDKVTFSATVRVTGDVVRGSFS